MPLFGSGWTRRLFEQFLAGTDLQGFPHRYNYTCESSPVGEYLQASAQGGAVALSGDAADPAQ
jgi:hypothetical protein